VRLHEGTERMNAELVAGDYFRAAGVIPALGRPLTPEDDLPGAPPAALVSYSLWETRYAKSPSILGSTIWINRLPFVIVGVMPKGYQGMLLDWFPDCSLWTSLVHFNRFYPSNTVPDFQHHREVQMFMMLARLRPGVTVPQLQAALDVLATRVAARPDYRFLALPSLQARFFPAYRDSTLRFLWMLLAVSAAAVAIACFNLAGLLLARTAARRHEIGTRLAIGASRFRVLQQFVVENAVLAIGACVLSLPVAFAVAYWLRDAPLMDGFTLSLDLSPDWRALGAGMLAGLLTAIAAGAAPALRASRGDVMVRAKS
jgi:macrolide transport system ATP-binding/permease protein